MYITGSGELQKKQLKDSDHHHLSLLVGKEGHAVVSDNFGRVVGLQNQVAKLGAVQLGHLDGEAGQVKAMTLTHQPLNVRTDARGVWVHGTHARDVEGAAHPGVQHHAGHEGLVVEDAKAGQQLREGRVHARQVTVEGEHGLYGVVGDGIPAVEKLRAPFPCRGEE